MSALDPLATSVNARGSLQRSQKYASAARTPALSSHRFLTLLPPRLPLQPTTSRGSGACRTVIRMHHCSGKQRPAGQQEIERK